MSVSYLGKRTYTTLVRPVNNQALASVLVNVAQGGTGQANGFSPYALVAANSAAANSDTQALESLALGSLGQVLVSSGSSAVPTWQSLSGAGAITSVASVANQTTVSILAGVATVGTVQDIGPVSTPSFNGLTLSNKLAPSSGGTGVSPATIGEILVASGAGSYTLVSPNTTATRKFLKQVSSVSTWDTLLASDVPASNLSTTNDTNVTITASVAGCLLAASTITLGWTGTLAVGRGGTGLSTFTTPYGVVCAGTTATGSLQNAGAGTAGQWLRSGGSTALPAWTSAGAISKTDDTNVTLTLGGSFSTALLNAASLTLGWTGTLAVGRGGTGLSTFTTAYGVVCAGTTATGSLQNAGAGTAGQWLRSGGSTALPAWTSAGAISKTDDTNVTLTLGGSFSTALLNAASLTLGWTGTLAVGRGGTGLSTFTTAYGVVCAGTTATGSLQNAGTGTANQWLRSTGTTSLPSWTSAATLTPSNDTNITLSLSTGACLLAASTLTVAWSGTLAVGRGGTGLSTFTTAYGVVCAGTTATGALQNAGTGTTGQWLRSGGALALPTWTSPATLTPSNDTNITLSLSTGACLLAASTLTVAWSGTLAVGRGGTGLSTLTTAYGVVCAGTTATGALQNAGTGTVNQWLRSTGSTSLPAWTTAATLTPSNDTNITLSVSTGACLLAASTLTVGWTGTLDVTRGGTGLGTFTTAYGVVCAGTTATGALQNAGAGTTGQWLKSGGAAALPTWTAPAAFTRTDDTNVTLTLSGNPGTALLNTMNIAAGWAGNLAASRGGTGMGFYNVGDMLYADTTTSLAATGGNISTTRKFLRGTGTGLAATAPVWDTLLATDVPASTLAVSNDTNITGSVSTAGCLLAASTITLGFTGQLAVSRGGTGAASLTAYGVLCGGTTSTSAVQVVTPGTSGYVLTSGGTGALPSWQALSGIGVTSLTGTTNRVTVSASTGAVTLSGPQDLGTSSNPTFLGLTVNKTGPTAALTVTTGGNVVPGSAALATSATDGFMYLPTCAGKPTGTPTTFTGRAAVVIDTTNNQLCYYNPSLSAWISPGWAIISKTTTSGGATTVTMSSIPAVYTNLRIHFRGSQGGATPANLVCRFNNDTGSNYKFQELYGQNTSAGAGAISSTTYAYMAHVGTGLANTICHSDSVILGYTAASTDFYHGIMTQYAQAYSGTSNQTGIRYVQWLGSSAINRIDFFIESGANFVNNSVITLYGYM